MPPSAMPGPDELEYAVLDAIVQRDTNVLAQWLKDGLDPDMTLAGGQTLLQMAVERLPKFTWTDDPPPAHTLDVVRVLLDAGARPDVPVQGASSEGSALWGFWQKHALLWMPLLEMMEKAGADFTVQDNRGSNLFMAMTLASDTLLRSIHMGKLEKVGNEVFHFLARQGADPWRRGVPLPDEPGTMRCWGDEEEPDQSAGERMDGFCDMMGDKSPVSAFWKRWKNEHEAWVQQQSLTETLPANGDATPARGFRL
jgi:hypothetical protein